MTFDHVFITLLLRNLCEKHAKKQFRVGFSARLVGGKIAQIILPTAQNYRNFGADIRHLSRGFSSGPRKKLCNSSKITRPHLSLLQFRQSKKNC
jgi:hypothetical protein